MFDQNSIARLNGANVYSTDGEKIGSVGQIYLDDQTNQPTWATVSTGWFGTSETFVPLDGASQDDNGDLRVAYAKDVVKDAPRIDPDGHLDEAQQDELYAYYQGQGYTGGTRYADGDVRDGDVRDDGVVRDDRDAALYADTSADRADLVEGDRADLADGERVVTDDTVTDGGTVQVNEERLRVGTEQVETGRVRLRKYVTTDEETVTVPVQREVVSVERTSIDGDDVQAGEIVDDGEQIEEVTLREERPVVAKETVGVEEVRLNKDVVTDEQQVTETVRKEHVDVDGDVDGDRNLVADGDRRVATDDEGFELDGDRDLDLTDADNDGRRIEREKD